MKKAIVSLRLMSEILDPDALAAGLRATIDASWRKGARRGKTSLTHAENGVEIRVPAGAPQELEEQLSLLMERVRPDAEHIRGLGCDCVQLSIVVYDTLPPSFHFAPNVIKFLGRLGASIDVDQYLIEEGSD